MKIKLTNKTHWRSDHIRAFLKRLIREERPDLCKRGAPIMHVEIVYTRTAGSSSSSGQGMIRGNWIKVRLSKHAPDPVDFAMVIAHELAHTRGMRDERMMRHSARYGRVGSWRQIYGWAEALPLEHVAKVSKVVPIDRKVSHVQKMLKLASTREKRAVTLRKKWERRLAYYVRRAA